MMCGITGTPGTGKSSVAAELERRGHRVIHISDTIGDFVTGDDPLRDTRVIDDERWAAAFPHTDGVVEGHLAHLLPCDRIVVLRCRPDLLRSRLLRRGYPEAKCAENAEAEALDVILTETVERYPDDAILELDTTILSIEECACRIEQFMQGELPPAYGGIDWSHYLIPQP